MNKTNDTQTGRDMPRFWKLFEDVTGNKRLEPVQQKGQRNETNRGYGKWSEDEKVEGAANTNKSH